MEESHGWRFKTAVPGMFWRKTGTFFVSPVSALTTLSSHLMRLVVSSRSNTEEAALRTSPISSLK